MQVNGPVNMDVKANTSVVECVQQESENMKNGLMKPKREAL